MKAPLLPDEPARLQALRRYSILDTLEEQAFDDITMLASFICGTPIALMSMVDAERQWFKSRVGLEATQTPREVAFCAHAILEPDKVMIVNDATSDPRFRDNPLVTGDPQIRFYAGAPLVTADGFALGTICVIDRFARQLQEQQVQALAALSRQVVAQLELRRSIAELDRSANDLRAYNAQLEDYQQQLQKAFAALEEQSMTDALTNVRNRRAFDRALKDEFERAKRGINPLSVLFIDIDKFKPYNDAFGHPAGDRVLRQVAQLLVSNSRPFDIVARHGGEEFAVILPGTDAAAALAVAERMRLAIAEEAWLERTMTISVGVSTMGPHTPDEAALVARADVALYRAKQLGRNRVVHAAELA